MTYWIIGIFTILFATFFDGLWNGNIDNPNWWKRHVFKWLAFFPPMIYILYTLVSKMYTVMYTVWFLICFIVLICLVSWALWQLGMRLSGKQWPSIWIGLLKKILDWLKQLFKEKRNA